MGAIITLTTDFGLSDGYVAAMKGVALGINPEANLVDICHTVAPQNIPQAAFLLGTVHEYFPARTVHLVVVDPGVGTGRRAVILRTPHADFVAPDNGVLTCVIEPFISDIPEEGGPVKTGPEVSVVAITNQEFCRSPVSPTFHGRDIFAPVAAHLSRGVSPDAFGEPVDSLTILPVMRPRHASDGTLTGHVRHVDTFGNIVTDIRREDLPQGPLEFGIGGHTVSGLSLTYGTAEGLMALIGSGGYLEIALRDGSAAALLGISSGGGDPVTVVMSAGG